MAYEDFTTYTEVDEDGDITVTPSKCNVSTMRRDAYSYVRKDMGSGHFGDFEHFVTVHLTSAYDYGECGFWAISNSSNTKQQMTNNAEGLRAYVEANMYWEPSLYIRSYATGQQDSYKIANGTTYYLTVERSGATLTAKIYSDAARTNLLDTLAISCDVTTYRYIYGVSSAQTGAYPAQTIGLYSENFDLQEAVAPPAYAFVM